MSKVEIPNFKGYYADTDGNIWSEYNGKWGKGEMKKLKTSYCTGSYYPRVTLKQDGKKKYILVSRLIADIFIPNPKKRPYVLHNDNNIFNNNVDNLRWGNQKENMEDCLKAGTRSWGERNGHAKIEEKDVIKIRKICKENKISQCKIGELFGLCQQTISSISRGINWKHITI